LPAPCFFGPARALVATVFALLYAGLGDKEAALRWLERGAESGASLLYLGIDPAFRSLRGEPRFKAVLKKIGLPE